VLERKRINNLAGEWKLQMSGHLTTEDAVEVGEMLGVKYLVMGSIGKVGKTFSITAELIDIESSLISKSSMRKYKGDIDGLLDFSKTIGYDITGLSGLSDLIENNTKEWSLFSSLAYGYYKSGNYLAALLALQETDRLKPYDEEIINMIGNCHFNMKDYNTAIQYYQSVILLNPQSAIGHYGLGNSYMNLDKRDDSIESLKMAVSLDQDNELYHFGLGWAYAKYAQYEKAMKYLENSIRLNPENYGGLMLLGLLTRENGDLEKAIKLFERAVDIRPDIAKGHHNLAVLYAYSGFYNESIKSAQQAIDLEPENHLSYMTRGYSYYKMGNYARSIQDMQKALQFLTQSEEDMITKYGIQGGIEYLKGNYQKSVEYYQRVAAIDKDANWAIFGIALSDLALGRVTESKKSYKQALSVSDQFDKMEAIQDLKILISRGIMTDDASEILQTIFDE